jgi:hypothetical protein
VLTGATSSSEIRPLCASRNANAVVPEPVSPADVTSPSPSYPSVDSAPPTVVLFSRNASSYAKPTVPLVAPEKVIPETSVPSYAYCSLLAPGPDSDASLPALSYPCCTLSAPLSTLETRPAESRVTVSFVPSGHDFDDSALSASYPDASTPPRGLVYVPS